eukprot:TRINITY_DN107907_c0_g1_i1.p1 TRINITY_DN107907_c0_g1~~TRINITY_DN107907_c0_g1_i1.p1  ORF type:complete len:623 (+),score=185.85 TRINITY_DN107907_c0_g1_i1:24-1871(+)
MAPAVKARAKSASGVAKKAAVLSVKPAAPEIRSSKDTSSMSLDELEIEVSRASAATLRERSKLTAEEVERRALSSELSFLIKEHEELQSRLRSAELAKKQAESQVDAWRLDNNHSKLQLESMKEERMAIQAHLGMEKQQRQNAQNQTAQYAKEVQLLRQRMALSVEEATKMKAEMKSLSEELMGLKRQLATEEQAKSTLEKKLEEAREERDNQRVAVRRARQEQRSLQSQIGAMENEKHILASQVSEAEKEKVHLEQCVGRISGDHKIQQERLAILQKEVKKLKVSEMHAKDAEEKLESERLILEGQKHALQMALHHSSSDMAQKRTQMLQHQLSITSPLGNLFEDETSFPFSPSTRLSPGHDTTNFSTATFGEASPLISQAGASVSDAASPAQAHASMSAEPSPATPSQPSASASSELQISDRSKRLTFMTGAGVAEPPDEKQSKEEANKLGTSEDGIFDDEKDDGTFHGDGAFNDDQTQEEGDLGQSVKRQTLKRQDDAADSVVREVLRAAPVGETEPETGQDIEDNVDRKQSLIQPKADQEHSAKTQEPDEELNVTEKEADLKQDEGKHEADLQQTVAGMKADDEQTPAALDLGDDVEESTSAVIGASRRKA